MRPEDTPWLDAHSLRMQIDEVLPAVIERAKNNPDHQFSGMVQGKLLRILAVIREHFSSRLILDTEIWEWLWERAPKELPVVDLASPPPPITAEEMWIVLGSVRASLRSLEELEAQGATHGSTTAAADVPRPWGSVTEPLDPPPSPPGNWPEGPGDRQYRISVGRQSRRAGVRRSSELPW
jgi:hypothetical protein